MDRCLHSCSCTIATITCHFIQTGHLKATLLYTALMSSTTRRHCGVSLDAYFPLLTIRLSSPLVWRALLFSLCCRDSKCSSNNLWGGRIVAGRRLYPWGRSWGSSLYRGWPLSMVKVTVICVSVEGFYTGYAVLLYHPKYPWIVRRREGERDRGRGMAVGDGAAKRVWCRPFASWCQLLRDFSAKR